MRRGDRDAAAEFMVVYGPRIRRRFRSLISRALHRIFDTEDLLSTVARRLDEIVLRRRLQAHSVQELWSLIARISSNSASRRALEGPRESGLPESEAHPLEPVDTPAALAAQEQADLVADACVQRVPPRDHDLVRWRLERRPFGQIASLLGIETPAARKRWERIAAALRSAAGGPAPPATPRETGS
jgi:DNA-directed RNA polymerase specialized sigma24 family protein